jgi:hypothetical protein
MGITGWTMWKGSNPVDMSLHESKDDLLIGYDLIPLRGLDVTERLLAERGKVPCLTGVEVVEEGNHHCYAVTVHGALLLDMLSWSVCSESVEKAILDAAGYMGCRSALPRGERDELWGYWMSYHELKRDGRRRRTLEKLRARVEMILKREDVEVCPVVFKRVD